MLFLGENFHLGTAKGGPFLCIHWRRKDFVRAHEKELPSISGTTKQIVAALDRLNLTTVFLATDAPDDGKDQNVAINFLFSKASENCN